MPQQPGGCLFQFAHPTTESMKNKMMFKDEEINNAMRQLTLKNEQLQLAEKKCVKLFNQINKTMASVQEFIHVLMSAHQAAQNRLKVGSTFDLNPRRCTYNCGNSQEEQKYYAWHRKVYGAPSVEKVIK